MTDFRHRQANGDSGRWQGVMGDGCARWQKYWSHPSPTIPKLEKTKDHKWKLLGLLWTSETVIPGKFWECWSVSRTVNLYRWWHNNKVCWQGSPLSLCIKMTAWQEEEAFSINMAPHWLLKALLVSFFSWKLDYSASSGCSLFYETHMDCWDCSSSLTQLIL